ncbi:MAG TPA: ABC transporter substrate-binding protein [Limnochordales bacterium]
MGIGQECLASERWTRRAALTWTLGLVGAGAWLGRKSPSAHAGQAPFRLGTIAITWYPIFLYHLPVSVAREQGFFEANGVQVDDIVGARGGGETIRTITSGGLLLGEAAAAAAVLSIIRSREPFVIVGGGTKAPSDVFWVTLPDSPVRTIQDLRGRRVGYTSPGSVTEQTAILSLKRAGIDPQEVRLVAAGGIAEGLALLRRRELDAAAMLGPTYVTTTMETRIVFHASDYVPNYFQTLILARRSLVQEHPDVVRGFLKARRQGYERMLQDVPAAARLYARLNRMAEGAALQAIRIAGVDRAVYHSDGRLVREGLLMAEEGMRIAGDMGPNDRIPWREIVDQSFLDPDQRIELP